MTRGTRKEAHRRDGEFQFLCVWTCIARAATGCDGELDTTAAMAVALVVNLVLQRDFAAEWAESLRVKDTEPMGEVAVERMLERGDSPGRP